MNFEIHPGRGVGSLRLGASRREVEGLLGTPDHIDRHDSEEDSPEAESWEYERLGLWLHFQGDARFRLALIDLDALDASIGGVRPIGLEIEEARKLFGEVHAFELDENFPDTSRAVYDLRGSAVSLWFQDGVCDSVQVAVPIAFDGAYVWPTG